MKIKIAVEVDTQAEALEIVNKLYGSKAAITIPQNNPPVIGTAGDISHLPVGTPLPHLEDDGATSGENVTGQVDSEGLPWDGRIHSSNKKKKANGAWVSRRNVDEATYNTVIAELRGQTTLAPVPPIHYPTPPAHIPVPQVDMSQSNVQFSQPAQIAQPQYQPALVQQPQPAATPYADIPAWMQNAAGAQQAQPQPQPLAQQPVYQPAPVAQPVVNTAPSITDFFNKIQQVMAADPVNGQAYITSVTQRISQHFQLQVNSVNDITGRPDMISFAMQLIANDGK